jgi:hypothetical protein
MNRPRLTLYLKIPFSGNAAPAVRSLFNLILEPGTPATGEAEAGSGGVAGQRLQGEGQVRL